MFYVILGQVRLCYNYLFIINYRLLLLLLILLLLFISFVVFFTFFLFFFIICFIFAHILLLIIIIILKYLFIIYYTHIHTVWNQPTTPSLIFSRIDSLSLYHQYSLPYSIIRSTKANQSNQRTSHILHVQRQKQQFSIEVAAFVHQLRLSLYLSIYK